MPVDQRFVAMLLKSGYKASQPRDEEGKWTASMTTKPNGQFHYDIKGPEGQHYTRTSRTRDDYSHALLGRADDGTKRVVSMHASHEFAQAESRRRGWSGGVLELATGKVTPVAGRGASAPAKQAQTQAAPEPDAPPVHPDGKPIKPKGLQVGTKGQPKNLRDLQYDIGRVSHAIRYPTDKGVDPQHYSVLRRMAEALAHHHGTDPQHEYDMALAGHDPRGQGYKDFKDQMDADTAKVKAEHAQFDPIKNPPPPPAKAKRVKKFAKPPKKLKAPAKKDYKTVIGWHTTGAPVTYHGPSIKNARVYEKLRSKGYDKSKSAAISNAMANKYGASTLRPKKVKKLTLAGSHGPSAPTSSWLKPGSITSQGGRPSSKVLSTPRKLPRLNLTTGRKPPKSSLEAFHGRLTRSTGGSAQMGRGGTGSTVGGNRTYRV